MADLWLIDVQLQFMIGIAAASAGETAVIGGFDDTEFITSVMAIIVVYLVFVGYLAEVAEGIHVDCIYVMWANVGLVRVDDVCAKQ